VYKKQDVKRGRVMIDKDVLGASWGCLYGRGPAFRNLY